MAACFTATEGPFAKGLFLGTLSRFCHRLTAKFVLTRFRLLPMFFREMGLLQAALLR